MDAQYVYRTPIVVFLIMFFSFLLLNKKAINYEKFILIMTFSCLFLAIGFVSGIFGNVLIGLSGLLKISFLKHLGLSIGGKLSSTRGNAAGTTTTRIIFWFLILSNALRDFKVLLFGNGFSKGFLDVVAPNIDFKDKSLIEPHNSFIGVFFKSGFLGLLIFLFYIKKIVKFLVHIFAFEKRYLMPFLLGALSFASMEVALENPHGAFIFWFFIFAPVVYFSDRKGTIYYLSRIKRLSLKQYNQRHENLEKRGVKNI